MTPYNLLEHLLGERVETERGAQNLMLGCVGPHEYSSKEKTGCGECRIFCQRLAQTEWGAGF